MNGIKKDKISKGFKIICRFFKEVGLYEDFKKYQAKTKQNHGAFNPNEEDPLIDFGQSHISHWIFNHSKKHIGNITLYHAFIMFVEEFYPEMFNKIKKQHSLDFYEELKKSGKIPCNIYKSKRKINLIIGGNEVEKLQYKVKDYRR